MVEVDHGNGFSTRYGHLSRIDVKVGDHVVLGGVIGEIGSSGRSTGPHLHYEVRRNGDAIDPLGFLKAGMKVGKLLWKHSSRPLSRGRRPAARAAVDALRQRGFHELVEVAVEHVGRAGALDAGAQILHQLVGLQHVGADLVAPADVGLGGLGRVGLRPRASSAPPRRGASAASPRPWRGSCAASARPGRRPRCRSADG